MTEKTTEWAQENAEEHGIKYVRKSIEDVETLSEEAKKVARSEPAGENVDEFSKSLKGIKQALQIAKPANAKQLEENTGKDREKENELIENAVTLTKLEEGFNIAEKQLDNIPEHKKEEIGTQLKRQVSDSDLLRKQLL